MICRVQTLFVLLTLLPLLTGCASLNGSNVTSTGPVRLGQAQACAIGYDMARQIHTHVSLRQTVLLAPKRVSPCEAHALNYLRQAGFRIDETQTGGASFDITLTRAGEDTVLAIARIGADLRITRAYQPVHTGVIAAGPVSVQHLAPDTYTLRRNPGAAS
ncbi:hypothetical protein [Ruegeria sp.]|uniref:hypothetical protein n=1 Tax=Ruegeria sp. TaxID=1879320 RepID=UPI003AFFD60E